MALQKLDPRFESGRRLNPSARMVELVDTQDLKSCVRKDVRVRPPLRVFLYNFLLGSVRINKAIFAKKFGKLVTFLVDVKKTEFSIL